VKRIAYSILGLILASIANGVLGSPALWRIAIAAGVLRLSWYCFDTAIASHWPRCSCIERTPTYTRLYLPFGLMLQRARRLKRQPAD
jgi:hypothetical protein